MRGARINAKSWGVLSSVVVLLAVFFLGLSLAQARKSKGSSKADTDDCKKDADCVAVADDCCPCSQGGKQRAIPKKGQAAYEKDRKKRCADTACTEAVSTDPSCSQIPICGAGICELGEPPAATP
jgi:hypothetical protein